MARHLIVEAEPVAGMADPDQAAGMRDETGRTRRMVGRLPAGQHGRGERILGKRVQHVGDQEFLVLLLVLQAKLGNPRDAVWPRDAVRRRCQQA